MFKWLKQLGGLAAVEKLNIEKARLLYDFLDASGFFHNPVAKEDRSRMNIPFTLKDAKLDEAFLKGAAERGMVQLKGHRSVGGMRASIYNAMPMEGVRTLVDYMREFEKKHGKARSRQCEILVINNIAHVGLKRFPAERYAVVKESKDPWAILVRSQDLHQFEFGPSLRAVGRAGAGVNNIPVPALSKRGIPVFNAPGANANAVKELVLAGMLIAARNLAPALEFTRKLKDENLEKKSRTARSSSPASSCRATRSASSAWARSAAWSPTRRSALA